MAVLEREARDRQAESRKQVNRAVLDLVKRYRSDDPLQRAEHVRRFHHVLLPTVQDLVLDKLAADGLHGSGRLKERSVRVLREIGKPAVTHLYSQLARSKQAGHRIRLLELLAAVVPFADFQEARGDVRRRVLHEPGRDHGNWAGGWNGQRCNA